MDKVQEQTLFARWKKSDLWPQTAEQGTGIFQTSGSFGHAKTNMFVNFCPEVTFDMFGLFAAALGDYSDELDRDYAQRQLERIHAPSKDYRWRWSFAKAMHYSECPLYSLLASRKESEISMDVTKRMYLEKRLANMADGIVDDCMQAVSVVMSDAALHNALGNSRVWLRYNEVITATIKSALPQIVHFTFDVADGNSFEATEILSTAVSRLEENVRAALIGRTSLSAQAFGEKPMYESLAVTLAKLKEQAVEDFSHGIEGGRLMKKNQNAGTSLTMINSPGGQIASGQNINQIMNQQSRILVDALDATLASDSFILLGEDQAGLVRGYADLVKEEIAKPKADTNKIKTWTEKIQMILTAANLVVESGKLGLALLGFTSG